MIVAAFIGGLFIGFVAAARLAAGTHQELIDELVRLNNEDYPGKPYTHPRVAP